MSCLQSTTETAFRRGHPRADHGVAEAAHRPGAGDGLRLRDTPLDTQLGAGSWACGAAMQGLPAADDAGGHGHDVVLLHASASSARQWAQAAAVLEAHPARLRVHTVEFHGHGAQPAWPGDAPLTLAHEAALVEPLLQRLGGAHVVGHSYGGAVALELACRRPGLVRSVVAFEPVLFSLLRGDAALAAQSRAVHEAAATMRQALAAGRAPAAARHFVHFWSGPGSWDAMAAERRRSTAARVPALLQQFDALFDDTMNMQRLARLQVPLLLLSGARTVDTARALMRQLRAALPHAAHEVLPEMGHMGPVTHAAAFNQRIAAFITALIAGRARQCTAVCEVQDCVPACPACWPDLLVPDLFRTLS